MPLPNAGAFFLGLKRMLAPMRSLIIRTIRSLCSLTRGLVSLDAQVTFALHMSILYPA